MNAWNAIRQRTAENATMLCAFTETPEAPQENALVVQQGRWSLPVERECQLAEDFAFISSYRHSSDEVTAVCLEEGLDGRSMTVRVAANAGDLDRIVRNLQAVADIMVTAVPRDISAAVVVERLLSRIVSMDRQRILTRLRSKHARRSIKTVGKPALPALLMQTVCGLSSTKRAGRQKPLQDQCRELHRLFGQLEEAKADEDHDRFLWEIVRLCHRFAVPDLVSTLASRKTVDPSTKSYIPEAIQKLGRYAQVAHNLTNAARSSAYSVFDQISISPIPFNQTNAQTFRSNIATFETILARLDINTNVSQTKQLALNTVRQKHKGLAWKATDAGKVHAEIQLIFFLSTSPSPHRPPRIICSSKSTCYLCSLFIHSHGTFSTPRTHGRLYNKWTLPTYQPQHSAAFAELSRAAERMNRILEAKIKTFASPSSSTSKARRGPPNESVIAFGPAWASTSTLAVPVQQAPRSLDEVLAAPFGLHVPAAGAEASAKGPRHARRRLSLAKLSQPGGSSIDLSAIGANLSVTSARNAVVHAGSLTMDFSLAHDSPPIRVSLSSWTGRSGGDDEDDANAFLVDVNALPEDCDTVIPVGPAMPQNRMRFMSRFGSIEVHMEYGVD